MKRNQLCILVASALMAMGAADISAAAVNPQTTAFTYQGQLLNNSELVTNVSQTFTFTLYDAVTGGNVVAVPPGFSNPLITSGNVSDGLFTIDLDFGLVFTSNTQYYLEVTVGSGGGAQTLTPRQRVDAVPVAQYALSAGNGAGATGPTGATGPSGPAGASGAPGVTGPTGIQGIPGNDGAKGDQGAQGLTGLQGIQGPTGPSGASGPQGGSGLQGASGAPGTPGTNGSDGATGPTGAAGLNWRGPWGGSGGSGADYAINDAVSDRGSSYVAVQPNSNDEPAISTSGAWTLLAQAGAAGATGATGASGSNGNDGATGPRGQTGDQGATGVTGASGASGATGASGLQGPTGVRGPTGIQGPTGAQGITGAQGPTGVQGASGVQGPTGLQGLQGATGTAGTNGATGPAGTTGPTGPSIGASVVYQTNATTFTCTTDGSTYGVACTQSVTCPAANPHIISGGAAYAAGTDLSRARLVQTFPVTNVTPNKWTVTVDNENGTNGNKLTFTLYAICSQ